MKNTVSNNRQNLYLVGFMGVGKSSIGSRVAKALGMEFFDSDYVVEQMAGKSVRSIFDDNGEDIFRKLEKHFFEKGHPDTSSVVACGGGVLVSEGMLELLKSKGVVIGLFAKPESILARTQHRTTRPLLNVENKDQVIRDLLEQREKTYLLADNLIMTDGKSFRQLVSQITRIYQSKTPQP